MLRCPAGSMVGIAIKAGARAGVIRADINAHCAPAGRALTAILSKIKRSSANLFQ